MENKKIKIKKIRTMLYKIVRRSLVAITTFAVAFSSFGPVLTGLVPEAKAATTSIEVTTIGLPNQNPGSPIGQSSPMMPIAKIIINTNAAQTLTSIGVAFGGSGFVVGDLNALFDNNISSGIALYNDAGVGNTGFFGAGDLLIPLTGLAWSGSNVAITPASTVNLSSGSNVYFIVIRTSATAADGHIINASIAQNGVVTNGGNGPLIVGGFTTNGYRVDAAPLSILSATGAVGSPAVNVRFSKPVQKIGGGSLVAASFAISGGKTISSVNHNPGMDFAGLTLSANLASGDFAPAPITIAAASNEIVDMGGNVLATTPATNLVNAPIIDTASIPAATAGTAYSSSSPLVTFAASGGTGAGTYRWAAGDQFAIDTLANLGLTLGATDGKLTTTTTLADKPGSYFIKIKVTDNNGAGAVSERVLGINVAPSGGGGVPGISSITPPGGAKGSNVSVTITGTNTHFSSLSAVQFLSGGTNDTKVVAGTVTSSGATNISFPVAIDATATDGSRDVRITTGTEIVTMPYGFNIFMSGGSGLNLFVPSSNATNVPIPPNFNFSASGNATINSYRITVNSASDFSGTTLWDYAFPRTGGHCDASGCNVNYGAGQFLILTQPTPLLPNTAYFWKVRTYTGQPISPLTGETEATNASGFTTVSSVTDTMPPGIQHRPVFQAKASTDLNLFARVMDNMAKSDTTPPLTSKIFYCAGSGCTPTTEGAAPANVGGGYYKFVIPGATIGASGTIVRYYLQASDGSNISNFKGPGDVPFQLISTTMTGTSTITGTVKDSAGTCAAGVQNATVFTDGMGFNATTDGSCAYTLSSLSAGTYDLVAVKGGYSDRRMDGIPAGSSNINFQLNQGFGGGFGGDLSKPHIKWNGPNDGMNGVPGGDSNFKIFVAFDKPMSQMSVTTAGNMTVNEVNMSTGELSNITTTKGSWAYYTSPQPNLPPESSLAVWSFSGTNIFGDNKNIAVKITPNVTDTAGNPIQGNQPDGSYAFMFTTGSTANFSGFNSSTGTFSGGGTFGQGAFMPPHVVGTMPAPGMFDVPTNTKVVINFSDPMADDGGGYLLKDFITLHTVTSGAESANIASSAIDSVSLDSAKLSATISLKTTFNPVSGVGRFAASTSYRLKVLGGAKSASGMTISPPNQASSPMFISDFKTGTSADTSAPNIVGSYPIDDPSGLTSIPVNIGAVNVGFNKDMDVSTITNTAFYLSVGSTTVNGTVEYRGLERQAFFVPKNALNPNTTYTINVTTDVKGVNGVAVAATATQPLTRTFKTGGADTGVPSITFMNADDYALAITFSEPMNAAKATDALNWATSVINPSAYHLIKYGDAMFNAVGGQGTAIPLTTATFKYDSTSNTVIIEGLDLKSAIGKEVYLEMDINGSVVGNPNISKDLSGNLMTSPGNVVRTRIQDSQTTKGALGPMAQGGSAFDMGGGFVPTNFSSTTFGFAPPVEVKPFNMMAGKSTIYGVRLPISRQIPAGGTILLTFPTGFDVASAQQDINSPMRRDLNGPGAGDGTNTSITFKCQTNVANGKACPASGGSTVTGDATGDTTTKGGLADDGVVVNTSARTITIYLSAATNTEGHDFLTIDISGIVNSTVPKDFNTSGYTVDIKTKDGATVLESLTSMPFFIQAGGSYTLSGTITATGNTASGDIKVYLMSPMTGPMEKIVTFTGSATQNYSFTGLTQGDYMLFTDQSVFINTSEYIGKAMPEPVFVNAGTDLSSDGVTNNVVDYDFTLASASGGTTVTVNVTGGPASEPMDIFAGSPTGFRVKQITLNSSGAATSTLGLADGTWFVGVGPQMPKGPMSGPPPAPTYMPPKPKEIRISGGSCTIDGAVGCSLTYTLATSNKKIKGVVKDGSSKVMANAEVYGYSPNGGFGTHAQSDSAGNFTLNVVSGSFVIGAFVPGMPSSKEVPVTVTTPAGTVTDDTAYLLIDGATTAISPNSAATAFILKVAKPDFTISGKVTDGTNVVQGASVYAYRTNGPGHANANTDSSGSYTLYVSAGAWNVGSFLPQYGQLTEQAVTISASNATNINFSPTQTGTFYEVSGRVYKDVTVGGGYNGSDVALQGVFVRLTGNGAFNETTTGSDGQYSFKVRQGNGYILKAFAPGIGELPPLASFNVSGVVTGKDFPVTPPKTVTFTLSAAVTEAFIDAFSTTGMGNHVEIRNGTSATMSLSNGSYRINAHIPGTNITSTDIAATNPATTAYDSATGILTVDGNEGLTITLPTLRTITGTITDGTSNISNAWVEIGNPTAGIHFGTSSNANGAFTLKVANASSDYFVNAMKPGYFGEAAALTVNATVADETLASRTLTIIPATTTISGQVLIGATGSTGASNAFIRAEKQGGGFSGTQADTNGNYILPVNAGTWKIYAVAEGYAEAAYVSNPITITTQSVDSKNIRLTAAVSMNAPKSKPITPSSGGTLEDTTAGIRLTIPANALGTSTSAGNIQAKETNNVRETSSAKPVKKLASDGVTYVNAANQIQATDSSGNSITTLNDSITIEATYTKAELAATSSDSDSSINTKTEADKLKMAYWDETTSNWVTLPSTIVYKDVNGATMDSSSSNLIPANNLSNVASVIVSAPTTHLSLYAPVSSTGALAPSTPAGLAATAASSTQINLSWTAVSGATSYDIYRSATQSGTYTRLGSEPTVSSGSTTSYADNGLAPSTTYYYKISALNNAGESAASSAVSGTTNASDGGSGGGGIITAATPPTNTSVIIAAGAVNTATQTVTLTLSAAGATQMAISNSSDFTGINWEAYAVSKSWVLASGEGIKTVYVKFRDAGGDVSDAVSDTIILENSNSAAPEIPTAAPTDVSAYSEGTLIKSDSSSEVYVIKSGKRLWIPNENAFIKGGYKWENIQIVSGEVIKQVGAATLIKVAGDPRVYVVVNNKRRHIRSAEEFNSAGYKWGDIIIVDNAEMDAYPEEEGAVVAGEKIIVVNAAYLRIRAANTARSQMQGWVRKGESYSVQEENNGWYKIQANGITGWVSGSYVALSATQTTTPVSENAVSANTSAAAIVITTPWLRVRNANSISGKIMAKVKKGAVYHVLEENNGWYKIKVNDNIIGWVLGEYVEKQ